MLVDKVVLFDFDGVVMDTETIYTDFWNERGEKYLGIQNFGNVIKGQTDKLIYDKYFPNQMHLKALIDKEIDELEQNMPFNFISGAEKFLKELKSKGVRTGLVTSSNDRKMKLVLNRHPDLPVLFDVIVTANDIIHPKPSPDAYLKAIEYLNADAAQTIVFEDSFYGLKSARDAGCIVVGVASTNTKEEIALQCDYVIDDFTQMTIQEMKKFYQ